MQKKVEYFSGILKTAVYFMKNAIYTVFLLHRHKDDNGKARQHMATIFRSVQECQILI